MHLIKHRAANGNSVFDIPDAELREMYLEQGLSSGDIARLLGCSNVTAIKIIHQHGIRVRTGTEAHSTAVYCRKFASEVIIDANTIRELYVGKDVTIREIARQLGTNYSFLRKQMIRLGIPIRNKSAAHKMPSCVVALRAISQRPGWQEANRQGQLRRYADPVEREKTGQAVRQAHVSDPTLRVRQASATREQMRDPARKKQATVRLAALWEGSAGELRRKQMSDRFKCLWRDPDFRSNLVAKRKENWRRDDFAAVQRMRLACCATPNKPETAVLDALDSLFPGEWKFVGDGQVVIDGLNPDFINVNGKKLIIEVFGDYWHRQARKPYRVNEGRVEVFAEYGYRTLIIWEKETKNKGALKQKIVEFAGSAPDTEQEAPF